MEYVKIVAVNEFDFDLLPSEIKRVYIRSDKDLYCVDEIGLKKNLNRFEKADLYLWFSEYEDLITILKCLNKRMRAVTANHLVDAKDNFPHLRITYQTIMDD